MHATADEFTNYEWYCRLFERMRKYEGAFVTVPGDPKLWGADPAMRKLADDILTLAREQYNLPAWDESELWWRTRDFAITRASHPFEPRTDFEHHGEYGNLGLFAYHVDKGEKETKVGIPTWSSIFDYRTNRDVV